jgi:uncharacterized protein (DUF1697 family)
MASARRPRTSASTASGAYVALLRGINVGGKNMLPMKDLAAMFASAGAADVRTYIQSGNVVFAASQPLAERLPADIQAAIAKRFGYRIPVVVRSARDLEAVVRTNPFLVEGAPKPGDEEIIAVSFLAHAPGAKLITALDAARSPPDEFVVRGREIYLRCPNGFARTKLTNAYFDAKLQTTSTARNWRTVLKLRELASL